MTRSPNVPPFSISAKDPHQKGEGTRLYVSRKLGREGSDGKMFPLLTGDFPMSLAFPVRCIVCIVLSLLQRDISVDTFDFLCPRNDFVIHKYDPHESTDFTQLDVVGPVDLGVPFLVGGECLSSSTFWLPYTVFLHFQTLERR